MMLITKDFQFFTFLTIELRFLDTVAYSPCRIIGGGSNNKGGGAKFIFRTTFIVFNFFTDLEASMQAIEAKTTFQSLYQSVKKCGRERGSNRIIGGRGPPKKPKKW